MSIYNQNSQLVNSPIIAGSTHVNIIQSPKDDIDPKTWEVLQDELLAVFGKLPQESDEYAASKKALACTMNKDKNGLSDVLKKNWASFSSGLFMQVAGGVLVELIKSLV